MTIEKKKIYSAVLILGCVLAAIFLANMLAPKDLDKHSFNAFRRGKIYLKKGDYQSAVIAFKTVVDGNPSFAPGYYYLGCAYDAASQVSPAIKAYRKAIELEPRYIEAQFNLGKINDIVGNYREGLEYYKAVLEIDPHHRDALFSLIRDYALTGRGEDARAYLETARLWFERRRDQIELDELDALIEERGFDSRDRVRFEDGL